MNPAETTFVSDLTEVPVVDVTTDNIDTQLPVIKQAIKEASVIALDLVRCFFTSFSLKPLLKRLLGCHRS